jgi:hypothetical protein
MVFIDRQNVVLDYWFERTKRMKTRKGETLLEEIAVKGVKARGVLLCGKKVISTLKAIELEQEAVEPEQNVMTEAETEESDPEVKNETEPELRKTIEEISTEAEALRTRMSSILKKFDGDTPDLFGDDE